MKPTFIFIVLYLLLSYAMAYSSNGLIFGFSILMFFFVIISYIVLKVKKFNSICKLSIDTKDEFLKNEFISLYLLIMFFGIMLAVITTDLLSIPDSLTALPGFYFLIGLPIHIFAIYEKSELHKFYYNSNCDD